MLRIVNNVTILQDYSQASQFHRHPHSPLHTQRVKSDTRKNANASGKVMYVIFTANFKQISVDWENRDNFNVALKVATLKGWKFKSWCSTPVVNFKQNFHTAPVMLL